MTAITNGTLTDIKRLGITLTEGQRIWLTDKDAEVTADLSFRDGIWVAIPDDHGFKDVPPNAPYHANNLK